MPNDNNLNPANFYPILKSTTAFRICAFGAGKFFLLSMIY